MIQHTRDLPPDATDEVVEEVVAHIRAELSAIAAADDDPETNADDVRVTVTREADKVRVVGELDAEPDAPYLRSDFDPWDGVPSELRALAVDDEVSA